MVNRFRTSSLVMILLGGVWLVACGDRLPTVTEDTADPTASALAATARAPATVAALPETATPTILPSSTPTSTIEPTPTQTSTPTSLPLNVQGKICYPSGNIPPMTVFFEETSSSVLVEMPVAENQATYEFKLESGTYIAYAWLLDFSRGGMYSRAVPCGLGSRCTDHTVLPFTINQAELKAGIDICDWFAGPFNVPYPPGRDRAEVTGTISGSLSYLEPEIPELRVVAFNIEIGYWYWVNTSAGQIFYTIDDLLPGSYHVVAYDAFGNAGGHAAGNHILIDVIVEPGTVSEGANINDWKAPPGTFPPDPTR